MEEGNVRKHLECFVAELLKAVPYNDVFDAAIQAAFDKQCDVPDELRPLIAKVVWWLTENEPLPLPDDYRFCQLKTEE